MKRLVLSGVALLLAILAQYWLQQDAPGNRTSWEAAICFAVAAILFLYAVRGEFQPLSIGSVRAVARSGVRNLACILGLIAIVLATIGALRFTTATPAPWGWTLHLVSVGVILLAALCYDLATRPIDAPLPSVRSWLRGNWLALTALSFLLAAAAILRLYRLDMLPEGIWFDEAVNALIAKDILSTPGYHPFYLESTFHTAHHNYLVALAFHYLGAGIGNARLVSALMGVLMVAAGWLAGFEYFQTRPAAGRTRTYVPLTMAIVMGALLVVVPWALNYSRIAVNYIATPFFALLAVGLLLHAIRTQRMVAWAAAALALAMGLYFYTSFRLFAPVLPLFMLAVLVVHRREWRTLLPGLVTITLVGLIAIAPLISFSATNLDEFFQRSRDTYLFKDAHPQGRAELLLDNAATHLLMFNVQGDPNGRHNLPYRPMLDPWLGGLFVVGFVLCLWRWRHPLYLLPLLWIGSTLLGGILTLPYEAPQSLRSNGALPAALLIALIPIAEMLRLLERSPDSRYYPTAAPALALVALVPLCMWNFNAFFRDQINDFAVWNAFSTAESLVGRKLATLSPDENEVWIMSPFIRRGEMHPSVTLLAPQWEGNTNNLNAWDSMPLVWNPEKDAWLFFDFDTKMPWELLRTQYPGGEFEEIHPPFVDTVSIREAHLSRQVQETARGALLRYYAAVDQPISEERSQQIALDSGASIPAGAQFAEWTTILRVPDYADYVLNVVAPANIELFLDETSVVSGSEKLMYTAPLAAGNHPLRLHVELADSSRGAESVVQLSWALPGEESVPIPAENLFVAPVHGNGLLGVYRAGAAPKEGESAEPPLRAAIDQQSSTIFHSTPVPRPFHAEWSGKLAIPISGEWAFQAQAIDRVRLLIDGEEIVLGAPSLQSQMALPLEAGLHDVRILYSAENPYSRYTIEWKPPGGEFVSIPNAALFTPRASWDGVVLPALALPPAAVTTPPNVILDAASAIESGPLIGAPLTIVAEGLRHPVGIAVGDDGRIFVAESAGAEVTILDEQGEVERTLAGGDVPLLEPFDLALAPNGELVVSDATLPALVRFSPDGTFLTTIATDLTSIDRARGIDVDDAGNLLIAQTPGQRIVHLDGNGALLLEYPAWQDAEAQPVDVLALANGETMATVLGINMLVRYGVDGTRILGLPIATANSQDAPHLAGDAQGNIFLTQPEERRILWYSPELVPMGHWQVSNHAPNIKPVGIAVDAQGRIWFTDAEGGRVGWVAGPAMVQP